MVKGYKALGKDMKALFGDGMVYEMNKTYIIETDRIIPNKFGYHFFDNIRDIFLLFYGKEYDIYEIEANDYIEKICNYRYNGKYVTDNIKIIRKLSKEEINKYIKENLDILINDYHWRVRQEVAKQGYCLDILVNDDYWRVRKEVAKQGYGLDILVNDENEDVRKEVAKQGYGLDILVSDEDADVRMEVASQGYGLDILINDEDEDVRTSVARQGYGLDKLINDYHWKVSLMAEKMLKEKTK